MAQLPRQLDREKRGALEIFVIGAVIVALFYGGIRLLADTHTAFNERNARHAKLAKTSREDSLQLAAQVQREPTDAEKAAEIYNLQIELIREQVSRGDLRCIGNDMFRKLPNGWESVSGDWCRALRR